MQSENELANDAAYYQLLAELARLNASMLDFASSAIQATIGLQRLQSALVAAADWPDAVLEDILDAEYITEE